jgi:hypothetical protein
MMAHRVRVPRRLSLLGAVAGLVMAASVGATPASAETHTEACKTGGCAWWRLDSNAAPTYLPPGDKAAQITVTARNLGDVVVSGAKREIAITDKLPPGLRATSIAGHTATRGRMKCPSKEEVEKGTALRCTYSETLQPYELLEVEIGVEVAEPLGTVTELPNEASLEGGEEPSGNEVPSPPPLIRAVTINGAPTPFGIERATLTAENEDGSVATQAGAHPFQMTTAVELNEAFEPDIHGNLGRAAPALTKDLQVNLPPGLIGNPQMMEEKEKCSEVDFNALENLRNACPASAAIGVAVVTVFEPLLFQVTTKSVPVFNLVPAPGEPARLGFSVIKVPVILDTSVRTGENYGVTVTVKNSTEVADLLSSNVTIWGVPGDPKHDSARGWACVEGGFYARSGETCSAPEPRNGAPFLSLPTSCGEPLSLQVTADSWREPGRHLADGRIDPSDARWKHSPPESELHTLEGCGALPFAPSLHTVEPQEHAANTPTGLKVDIKVPQETTQAASGLAEADVKATTVALPEGVMLNPAASGGLAACSKEQVGFTGVEEAFQTNNNEFSPAPPECPDASKVGTVKITTPLLPNKLEGSVYLALQDTNPYKAPLVLYLIARDPVSGVLVKLAGKVTPNPVTGQLVSTFENTPPVPFEDLELEFFNGPRASVTTPPLCGAYTTRSSFTPWSGAEAATPSAAFSITSGPGGTPCSNPQPFAPSLQAGSTNNQAGGFTPFSLTLERHDADQALSSITMHLPPGMAAILASVTPCPEPQAAQGSCGPESLIGHATSSSGLGADPFTLAGQVYLTGPYNGGPFGISIVTPAVAGPFNLGKVIVRSSINVDAYTAAVTIRGAIPTMVETASVGKTGIPVQLHRTNVIVDRPGFQFNPTNCTPMAITGTLGGAQGGTANVSSSFQVANCASLPFHPRFEASTQAKTSKANGASLTVKVASPGLGQANISKTKVVLPIALPSRLTTIQKACRDSIFEANPAACDEGSNIGTATIHTPVFKNPLSGPAYLVSHGNAAFPDIEFVLQGEGVTIILDGQTDIKKGITSSTFNALPDAPFTSFETVLPEGPHSALGAITNLCTQKLIMPTTITAQNGDVINQTTRIGVTGCPRAKALTRAQLLARALKACRKQFKHNKKKRAACEARARKKYGTKKASAKAKKGH